MTKRDLVIEIANDSELTQKQVAVVVQNTLDYIADELASARTIELRRFGVFEVKVSKERIGRNPNKPEDDVIIPKRAIVKFRPGKELKERVKKLDLSEI